MNYEDKEFRILIREAQMGAEEILSDTHHTKRVQEIVMSLKSVLQKLEEDAKLQIGMKTQIEVEKRKLLSFKEKQAFLNSKNTKIKQDAVSKMAINLDTIINETRDISKFLEDEKLDFIPSRIYAVQMAAQDIASSLQDFTDARDELYENDQTLILKHKKKPKP